MGKNASGRHISEVGNYGDKREHYASKYVLEHAPPNDPEACIRSLEEFDVRWTMLHLGQEKGEHLDRAVRALILEKRRQEKECNHEKTNRPIRALEIGSYIGYSAIRIGRILAAEADAGSTLLSVEQNEDNAGYAKVHVDHAGLKETVMVLHSKIEECFDDNNNNNEDDNYNGNVDIDIDETINNIGGGEDTIRCCRPYDFVFLDHRKPFYLRDLELLESRGVIDTNVTTVVADNVGPLEHLQFRARAIADGRRKRPCKCVNKACNFLDYVRRNWSCTEVLYGENTKDGISVSRPAYEPQIE